MKNKITKLICTIGVASMLLSSIVFAGISLDSNLERSLSNSVVLSIGNPIAYASNTVTNIDSTNTNIYPFIQNDTTLVPIRFISENLGAKVRWNEETKTVSISIGEDLAQLTIGGNELYTYNVSKELIENVEMPELEPTAANNVIKLNAPAQIVGERTFVPLRALVEALGKNVYWDDRGLIIISDSNENFNENTNKSTIDDIYKFISNDGKNIIWVNNESITLEEFKFFLNNSKNSLQNAGIKDFNIVVDGKKLIDNLKEDTYESIILYKVIAQEAKKNGIELDAEEILELKEQIEYILDNNYEAIEILQASELSNDQFEDINIEYNIVNRFVSDIKESISNSPQELKSFYNSNIDRFRFDKEYVTARHILIKTIDDMNNKLSTEEILRLKQKAEDILQKVKNGEDFAMLAKMYSEDPGSKDNGGEYTFPRGMMVKEFEDSAFALVPGQVSDLVETVFGYHIIKLDKKYEVGQIKPFDMAMDNVNSALSSAKYNQIIEELKENSNIILNEKLYNMIN